MVSRPLLSRFKRQLLVLVQLFLQLFGINVLFFWVGHVHDPYTFSLPALYSARSACLLALLYCSTALPAPSMHCCVSSHIYSRPARIVQPIKTCWTVSLCCLHNLHNAESTFSTHLFPFPSFDHLFLHIYYRRCRSRIATFYVLVCIHFAVPSHGTWPFFYFPFPVSVFPLAFSNRISRGLSYSLRSL